MPHLKIKSCSKRVQGIFKPLPRAEEMQKLRPFTDEQVKLGHQLWYEPRLSKGNTVSCNSYHNLASAGVDNLLTSQGHKGQFGGRNSPTALNAALLGMQFWDGRAADVEEQAGGPLVNPVEMANDSQEAAAAKVAKIPEYQELFKTAFPEDGAVSFKNITTALGAFERTLLTPTRWDEYLKGNVSALSEQERKGVRAFMDNGCIACHSGVNLGGNSFQKFGLVKGPYWKFIEDPKRDKGRADVTKKQKTNSSSACPVCAMWPKPIRISTTAAFGSWIRRSISWAWRSWAKNYLKRIRTISSPS